MRCPECRVIYRTTAVRRTIDGQIVKCPICGPQLYRAFLPGHPSHPDYQPLVIEPGESRRGRRVAPDRAVARRRAAERLGVAATR